MPAVSVRSSRAAPTVALALLLALVNAPQAEADIGIQSVSQTSGAAGERVQLLIYCGGCLPDHVGLPVSLLPVGPSPHRHPCRGTSCASTAPEAPMSAPYVQLGVASPLRGGEETARRLGLRIPDSVEQRGAEAGRGWGASIGGLRFRIPPVDPGEYTYVIYCKPF